MPKVLNLRDTGYKVPDGAVYVGRGNSRYGLLNSKWGNPFKVSGKTTLISGSREDVVKRYRLHLLTHPTLKDDLHELRGKDLVCWCAPFPCHADVLLRLANQ